MIFSSSLHKKILQRLASSELTLLCLGLMMILIVSGTLAQVSLGTYAAQKAYFDSVWVMGHIGDMRVPLLPGGLAVGALWLINLLAAFIVRFRPNTAKIGLYLSHAGLMLLLLGQFFTQALSRESQMPISVGETRNYSEDFRDSELVFIRSTGADTEEVISIPQSVFSHRRAIPVPNAPFSLVIRSYYPNAVLGMAQDTSGGIATQGIGPRIRVEPRPTVSTDDESNQVTAYVEVLEQNKSLGVWLVSAGLGAPQTVRAGGQDYTIALRPRRYVLPFSLSLKEFRHERYAGTDIPKNFASLVTLRHPAKNVERDTLIYMNHPLRYEGRTFYQASFGQGDQLSVLQVVQNPVWLAPYVSCAIMILGLGIHFVRRLYAK